MCGRWIVYFLKSWNEGSLRIFELLRNGNFAHPPVVCLLILECPGVGMHAIMKRSTEETAMPYFPLRFVSNQQKMYRYHIVWELYGVQEQGACKWSLPK